MPKTLNRDERALLGELAAELNKMCKSIEAINERLEKLEDRADKIGIPRLALTEAEERTIATVKHLATQPGEWVSIDSVARGTGRSVPTETNYLRYLYERKLLKRQAKYVGKGRNRRRIFVYRYEK